MIGEISALSAAFCWALSPLLYKKALRNTSYLVANLVRSLFAALLLLFILPATKYQTSMITINILGLITIAGVINLVIGDTLYFIGLRKIGIARTQSISSSYPLYSMLFAVGFLSEKLTLAVAIGTPMIVIGIAIISLAKNEENENVDSKTIFGVISPILAAIFWSIGLTTYKSVLNVSGIDPIFATCIRNFVILPFLLLAVFTAGESKQLRRLTKMEIVMLALGGILALGVGGILLFLSLSLIDASRAIPLSSITPFITLLFASRYGGEKFGSKIVIGTILIMIGAILITFYM